MIPNKIVDSTYGPMIINANDQYIGRSIEMHGYWAQEDIDIIKSLLELLLATKPQVVFYDIGANIGTHTVAIAKTLGNKVKIRSFEAQRQVYYLLCGNIAINGLDNVICHYNAVSDVTNNTMVINLPDYNLPNNFGGLELVEPVRSDNQYMTKTQKETVTTVCVDQFDEAVDFIKMDIEGMEHLALAGGSKVIAKHRPICFVEMYKTDIDAVKKFFKELDYIAYQYKSDDWIFFPSESKFCVNNVPKIEL